MFNINFIFITAIGVVTIRGASMKALWVLERSAGGAEAHLANTGQDGVGLQVVAAALRGLTGQLDQMVLVFALLMKMRKV